MTIHVSFFWVASKGKKVWALLFDGKKFQVVRTMGQKHTLWAWKSMVANFSTF